MAVTSTVAALRREGCARLNALGAEAQSEADLLLATVLGRTRAWLRAHEADSVAIEDATQFLDWLQQRTRGVPAAYLLGVREFWSLPLRVTPDVLVPRPDTERLVELALACLPDDRPIRVADLGTGSGAIALAIAKERPRASIVATDISAAALAVAQDNAETLGLAGRIEFRSGDWFAAFAPSDTFDAIVSNPPYIATDDPHLQRDSLVFEPTGALASGPDGLDALRILVAGAGEHLARGGWLLLEHGAGQGTAVRQLLAQYRFTGIETLPDLEGRDRVTRGRAS